MANDTFSPTPIKHLSSELEMRAYAHPTRMTILALLAREPLTLSMTAARLQVHPANLSRHFKTLAQAGLIVLVLTRDTGRNLEKYYQAAALSFLPDPAGLSPAGKRELALGALRDELSLAIQRLRSAEMPDQADLLTLMLTARLRHKDRAEFYRKLQALLEEFGTRDAEEGSPYTLGLCLFPAVPLPEGAKDLLLDLTERKKEK